MSLFRHSDGASRWFSPADFAAECDVMGYEFPSRWSWWCAWASAAWFCAFSR